MSSEGPDTLQTIGMLAVVAFFVAIIVFGVRGCMEDKCSKGEAWVIDNAIYKCQKTGDL